AYPYLSRDGKILALVDQSWKNSGAMHLWQLEGATPRRILVEANARYPDFAPDSRQVAVSYNDGSLAVFDLPGGRLIGRLGPDTLTQEVNCALHPAEPLVAVCSYYVSAVQLRDVRTGKVVASLPQPSGPHAVAWRPDGRTLAVGLTEGRSIRLYDWAMLHVFR